MVFEGKNIIYIMFNCSWEKGEKGKEEGKGRERKEKKNIFSFVVFEKI